MKMTSRIVISIEAQVAIERNNRTTTLTFIISGRRSPDQIEVPVWPAAEVFLLDDLHFRAHLD